MQSPSQRSSQLKGKTLGSFITIVVLIVASVLFWWNFQFVIDLVRYLTYQPTPAVVAIADRSELSDDGKFMFYASQPVLDGTSTFNEKCDRKERNVAILGCYVSGKIYIYDVVDERLDGIEEVSATHEMLHAVYERLTGSERKKLDELLAAEFAKMKNDPEFADRMAFYARTEPGERDNELHSIIGTEVTSISDELERHYAKYFDRSAVLALYADYKSEFTKLTGQAEQLKTKLNALKARIDKAKAQYRSSVEKLDKDIAHFNDKAQNGSFSSQAQFDSERQALVNRANQLKSDRDKVNTLVNQYNKLREQHNGIITQSNELYKSIDSSLAPAPKV